jgi:hypothetical protein
MVRPSGSFPMGTDAHLFPAEAFRNVRFVTKRDTQQPSANCAESNF